MPEVDDFSDRTHTEGPLEPTMTETIKEDGAATLTVDFSSSVVSLYFCTKITLEIKAWLIIQKFYCEPLGLKFA
jgi:hypothetical protein